MKARSAWIVTGALGAVGLGATMAAAQGALDAPDEAVVSPSVEVTTSDVATAATTAAATPSPTDVQNGTSITTVTAGSANTSASPTTASLRRDGPDGEHREHRPDGRHGGHRADGELAGQPGDPAVAAVRDLTGPGPRRLRPHDARHGLRGGRRRRFRSAAARPRGGSPSRAR
nr:hypothetical protein [Cellulosimicrobium sp. MM]